MGEAEKLTALRFVGVTDEANAARSLVHTSVSGRAGAAKVHHFFCKGWNAHYAFVGYHDLQGFGLREKYYERKERHLTGYYVSLAQTI